MIFFYKFFSTAKRTKSCRQQKIRGSAACRAETDASRETVTGCARSGGALFCRGISDRVIRLLAVLGKVIYSSSVGGRSPFFFSLYARPQSLSVLCNVFQPQFPRGERSASYPFLHARFHNLASSLIFKRRIPFPQLFRRENASWETRLGEKSVVDEYQKEENSRQQLFRSKEKHTLLFEGQCGPIPRRIFVRTNTIEKILRDWLGGRRSSIATYLHVENRRHVHLPPCGNRGSRAEPQEGDRRAEAGAGSISNASTETLAEEVIPRPAVGETGPFCLQNRARRPFKPAKCPPPRFPRGGGFWFFCPHKRTIRTCRACILHIKNVPVRAKAKDGLTGATNIQELLSPVCGGGAKGMSC